MTSNASSHGTWAQLIPVYRAIGEAGAGLPFATLLPGEYKALSGYLFDNGLAFVMAVAAGLQRKAELFPDAPVSGDALAERQKAATAWLVLRNRLQELAQKAAETYVAVQAGAIKDALEVVKRTRLPEYAQPADPQDRHLALVPALILLAAYHRTLRRKKDRRRQAREVARAAQGTPAPAPSPRKESARLRAEGERREREWLRIRAQFGERVEEFYRVNPARRADVQTIYVDPAPTRPQDTSRPKEDRMAQNPDDELRELFASLHQDQEVSADKALGTKLPDLEAAGDQAEAIFKQMPACDLDPAQRQGLAGKGFEAVQEICEEFAKGLARHKEMMQETHLSPGLFQATLAQGRAAGRLIKVGDLLSQGGDTGALLCAATADALCTRALGLVKDKAADQQVPGPTRSDLAIAFSEALRLDARRLERQQASKTTNEQAGAPLKTQITDAEEQAALSKLVSTFLSLVLKGLGGLGNK